MVLLPVGHGSSVERFITCAFRQIVMPLYLLQGVHISQKNWFWEDKYTFPLTTVCYHPYAIQ